MRIASAASSVCFSAWLTRLFRADSIVSCVLTNVWKTGAPCRNWQVLFEKLSYGETARYQRLGADVESKICVRLVVPMKLVRVIQFVSLNSETYWTR